MASKAYDIAFKLGAKMDKTFGSAFNAAENIAHKTVSAIKKTVIAVGAATLSVSAVQDCVDKAMNFESAMADVAKVVDGLKDNTGNATEAYAVMSDEILDMTARLPMAADEITQLIATAGQSGIAADELTRFAEDAAKMGVAFDLPAEKAGELAATIRSSLGMTQDEFVVLADKINYFGNTTTQSADKLIQVVQDTGLIGKQAGVSTDQIAAMSAAMNGMDAANMSTALSNIYGSLMTGSGATKAAGDAWESLGFTSEQVAKSMLEDSEGTMVSIFEAMQKLPKDQLASTTAAIFGNNKSTKMAIASFTENLDGLKHNFQDIGDATVYAGSMQDEFSARAATTENKIQLAKNAIDRLKITLGNLLLPIVSQGAILFGDAINSISERIPVLVDKLKDMGNSIKTSLKIDEIFNNLKPKLPAIQENAKYFADNFVGGVGNFLNGDSLSFSFSESLSGIRGILQQVLGEEKGDILFSGMQNGFDRISDYIEVIKTNVGEVVAVFKDSFGNIFESIAPAITEIMGAFNNVKTDELSIFSTILGGIKDAVIVAAPAISGFITAAIAAIGKIIPVVLRISGTIVQIVEMIVPILVGIFGEIMSNADFIINGIMAFVDAFVPVINGVVDTIMKFLPNILPVFQQLGSTIGNLVMRIGQALQIIAPLFASIFNFICQNIIPVAMVVFENLGRVICTVVDVIANVLPIIAAVLMVVWQAIQPTLKIIMNIFQFAFGFVASIIGSAIDIIGGHINNILLIFNGIIEFVQGVFTGNWAQAWQGVQDIFAGAFGALSGLIKAPLNAVISIVNAAIDGINSVNITVPDWVPGLGGKNFGFNVPKMPMLAKGSNYSPDTFIAGEKGAELVTNAKGSKVFTAAETGDIFNNLSRLPEILVGRLSGALNNLFNSADNISKYDNLGAQGNSERLQTVQSANSYHNSPVQILYNPQIKIDGKGQDTEGIKRLVEELLAKHSQDVEQIVRDVVEGMHSRRMRLANE